MADKSIGIIGASGFIGGALAREAAHRGWRVVGFSRRVREPGDGVAEWRESEPAPDCRGLAVVVNLAGESVAQRWTESKKRELEESRVGVTRTLVGILQGLGEAERPRVLVNGSAVGYYGDRGDRELDESADAGEGYLAELCQAWEEAAQRAAEEVAGIRVVRWRTGVVLGPGGEAWQRMRRVFTLGLGGRFGDGSQWMPWIHLDDLVGGMLHAIDHDLDGPVNGTAPNPVTNREFTRTLAAALGRPAFLHAPGFALKLALGGFGGALLDSQRAVPAKLLLSGYSFRFPTLGKALEDLL